MNLVKISLLVPKLYSKVNRCILVNPHSGKDERLVLKVRSKIAMFVVKFIDFSPEKNSTGYFSATDAPI